MIKNIYQLFVTKYNDLASYYRKQRINLKTTKNEVMKTGILTTIMVTLLSISLGMAQNADPDPKNQVKQEVSKQVIYPEFAVDLGIEGTVYASFKVGEDGSISVIQVESTDPRLKEYVTKKLAEIKVKDTEETRNEIFNMKFTFELL